MEVLRASVPGAGVQRDTREDSRQVRSQLAGDAEVCITTGRQTPPDVLNLWSVGNTCPRIAMNMA